MHMQAKTAGPLLIDTTMVAVVVVVITLRAHFDANPKHCTSHGLPLTGFALSRRSKLKTK